MLKTVFKHSAIYGLAPHLPKIASFITLPIITKHLTPLDYGVSGLISAYVGAIGVFSTLGLRLRLINSFYKHPNWYPFVWRQISGFLFFWNIPFALATAVLIYFAVPQQAMHNVWEIIALNVGALLAFGRASLLGNNYFQLTKQPTKVVSRSIAAGLISIGLNVYFIAELKMGYMGWFWSTFLSSIVTNGAYWYVINYKLGFKPIFNFKRRFIKDCLKVSLPSVPHYYSSYLLDASDRIVMNVLNIPAHDIGRYNSAYNFGSYGKTLANAFGIAVGPFYQENYKNKHYILCRNLIFNIQIIFLSGTFLLCLFLKEVFQVLIKNAELAAVYPLAIIIIMGLNYRPMYIGIGMAVMYNEKNRNLWQVTLGAGILSVFLNLIFIPLYGYFTAAVVTFVTYMIMGFALYAAPAYRSLLHVNYKPIFWLTLILFATSSVYLLKDIPFLFKISISAPVLVLLFLATRRFRTTQRKK